MSNWYVGQKVVCVKSGMAVSSGLTYTILDIHQCDCEEITFDVGVLRREVGSTHCFACGPKKLLEGPDKWHHYSMFRPLDTMDETIERLEAEGNVLLRELELVER